MRVPLQAPSVARVLSRVAQEAAQGRVMPSSGPFSDVWNMFNLTPFND